MYIIIIIIVAILTKKIWTLMQCFKNHNQHILLNNFLRINDFNNHITVQTRKLYFIIFLDKDVENNTI